jgi:hypothetical protein
MYDCTCMINWECFYISVFTVHMYDKLYIRWVKTHKGFME